MNYSNTETMEMRDPNVDGVAADELTTSAAAGAIESVGVENSDTESVTENETVDAEPVAEPEKQDDVKNETVTEPVSEPEIESETETVSESEIESETEAAQAAPLTMESLAAQANEILAKDPSEINSDSVRHLRQYLNTLYKAEIEEARKAWQPENDGDEFTEPAMSAAGEEIAATIEKIRARKAEWLAAEDVRRAANLDRKRAIVAEILKLADDTDNVNRTFNRYRELQDEFNATGDVPPTDDTAIWKSFQEARERYSDNLKINKELRDYDFKKNLETKQLLLDEAEALVAEEDVITAYRRLQELHIKWRQIGPVAVDVREEIWNNFKTASAEINKRYQAYFEARKAREQENEQGKIALCEEVEAIDIDSLRTYADWEQTTQKIMDAQARWRTFGFASKKMNKALFARFRAVCDKFFAAKAEFFRATREQLSRNLAAKTALVEQAEALMNSTDWKAATDKFVEMQKEWKNIGTVAKKHSDSIWRRFQTACDHFFEQKKAATSGVRRAETENLRAKRDIIAKLGEITPDMPKDEAMALLRDLQAQWQNIGHVPYREKDKLYEAYHGALDKLRSDFDLSESRARLDRFQSTIDRIEGDDRKLYRERERLVRAAEARRAELRTYENNLGFLSSKSKSGDSMLRDLNRRIERIKDDLDDLREKIAVIDSKL